jgi:hypothetical protein
LIESHEESLFTIGTVTVPPEEELSFFVQDKNTITTGITNNKLLIN